MIHTIVVFHVVAGRAAEFESGHRELIALMGNQPGCLEIRAHRSLSDPLEYMVYGSWKDKEAWERAHQTPRFRDLFQRLPVVEHTLSRSSFFELVYGTGETAYGAGEPMKPQRPPASHSPRAES